MNKIAVTGANGFLGKRFCGILSAQGRKPLSLVRSVRGADIIRDISYPSCVDFKDVNQLADNLRGVDCVLHLVSRAHILRDKYWDNDDVFCLVNVDITRNMIEACRRSGVKRFIYMSSVMAMGLLRDDLLTEDSECLPQTAYGRSKLKAEAVVKELCEKYGMDYCILRPPLVYGPGNKANMFRLFQLVDKGWLLPLAGIKNKRSFVYVDNLIQAALHLVDFKDSINRMFLMSDKEIVSTPQLFALLAAALDKPCRLIKVPTFILKCLAIIDKGAIARLTGSLAVDASSLERFIGRFPAHSMSQGLEITAKWYKDLK
jgi:nucleoside-diphosphate-sugar epimerase